MQPITHSDQHREAKAVDNQMPSPTPDHHERDPLHVSQRDADLAGRYRAIVLDRVETIRRRVQHLVDRRSCSMRPGRLRAARRKVEPEVAADTARIHADRGDDARKTNTFLNQWSTREIQRCRAKWRDP